MTKKCFGFGVMEGMHLFLSIVVMKFEIESLRKGYTVEGSIFFRNFTLTALEREMEEIDKFVRNIGSSGKFPTDSNQRENIWDRVKKMKEKLFVMKEELKQHETAFDVYCTSIQNLFETNRTYYLDF